MKPGPADPRFPLRNIAMIGAIVEPLAWLIMGEEDSDRRDMARAQAGEKDALGALYDRHAGLMLAVGSRMLGNRREAEDVVHDVFVEIWRRSGDYDPSRASVKSWFLMRMRSRCLDRLKSPRRRHAESFDAGHEANASAAPQESAKDTSVLHDALMALPGDQRQVLILGYFEGLSSSEIAERMGIPIGTVKSRVAAAMRRLRSSLRSEEALQ
jgi:RNA polymerase sigma-70 factor (ECF subfamily)